MAIKKIWSIIVKVFMAVIGFLSAWMIWGRKENQNSPDAVIEKKAKKAKEKAIEEVSNTSASDVGPKYLHSSSNAGIELVKKSATRRIMDRIRRGAGDNNPGRSKPGS